MLLKNLAAICRSKNAGPFELTLDVVLKGLGDFEHLALHLDKEVIAQLYGVPPENVLFIAYPAAFAFKATIPRSCGAGDVGDRDVYGAQQHGPLLTLDFPDS